MLFFATSIIHCSFKRTLYKLQRLFLQVHVAYIYIYVIRGWQFIFNPFLAADYICQRAYLALKVIMRTHERAQSIFLIYSSY